ncbi:hypothetical protein E2562_003447 [Oryza meyeriana var. granulata]|uniref:TROVE domain-containing protein n=1 Tax=Oryza meyeriana var. granulata TaxID=110450 RepID=A0A6G1EEM6_9ORYZ|nr:hypothetical protein E2562_003447 [Oryza meyeriana var. granulata]
MAANAALLGPPIAAERRSWRRISSSGDPCLDFFFQIVPGATPATRVGELLAGAWARDPRATLKLVCHLRAVRGLGKADREGFYAAALWMHDHHPRTLAANLTAFATFGCLKDLPEILYRVLHGPRDEHKEDDDHPEDPRRPRLRFKRRCIDHAEAARARREKEAQLAQTVLSRYDSDSSFRLLYDRVADTFADLLKSDVEHMRAGENAKISLAAKWCPSLRSSYDRATLLCEAIARRIFPRESSQEYMNISEEHYAYRVRNRLRREVLVPLRKVLELPEVYMTACKWEQLPYARVASVAMRQYKEAFEKHDKSGVAGFLDEVRTGHARVPVDAALPHELVAAALKGEHDEAAELQWRRMVSTLAAGRRLGNCIAVCGLSGSGDAAKPPGAAAIALGLLISELSQDPWKGRVITFDATQQLHKVRGATLVEKLGSLAAPLRADINSRLNLQAVFDRILSVAIAGGLPKDMMVRRVFVLSDMELDDGGGGAWRSQDELNTIRSKFEAKGFSAPEVVFWNVGAPASTTPVVAAQENAALVSGYSKNLVRLFLERDGKLTPAAVMADAISGPEYDSLEVVD